MRIVAHMAPGEVLTTKDAASLAGVSVATLNRWAAAGRIEPVIVGNGPTGARFFARADVEALLRKVDL